MKNVILKIFLVTCCFLNGNPMAQANFDEIEDVIFSNSGIHYSRVFESSEPRIQEGHQVTKTKYGEGDIVKTTFDDPWVLDENGPLRIEKCAYIATTEGKCNIVEHWVVENGSRIAQTYLLLPTETSPIAMMHYRFIPDDFQITREMLEGMFKLAFSTYNRYLNVTVSNFVLVGYPEHLALAEAFIASQEGLRVQPK